MENKFANLVLDQVEAVLTREPSADALYDMLRIASPLLDKASLKQEHPKLFKNLQTKVHPDRHVHSVKRAKDLFQALEPFHAKCVEMLDVISPRTISPSTTSAKRGRSPVDDSFDDFYFIYHIFHFSPGGEWFYRSFLCIHLRLCVNCII